jgi:hypothetical protein
MDRGQPVQGESCFSPSGSSSITTSWGTVFCYYNSIETLKYGSDFFAALFSGRWDNARVDGSYFIDSEPQIYEHIMRYLRRGVYPIFYDNVKGHNHAL